MAAAAGGGGREQCPRCASRDTKFCYYNNYNTAQPRHFCRACRRYWTLGGSLRNVPIGGSTRKRPRPSRPARAAVAAAIAAAAAASASGSQIAAQQQQAPPVVMSQHEAAAAAAAASGGGGGDGLLVSLLGAAPVLEGRLGGGIGVNLLGGWTPAKEHGEEDVLYAGSTVAKIGPWGGDYGGRDHDVTVAPRRLRSVSLRHGKIIDSIAFTYDGGDGDGELHSVGPWGGDGAELPEAVARKLAAGERPPGATVAEFTFDAGERVTEVHGTVGPFGDRDSLVTSLKLVTDRRTIGPFGYGAGTPFSVPVRGDGGVVGFFVRAGAYLEAIGVYVNPCIPSEK
ncbi:hypothetical protein OsJ_11170 [Oryza sativa Japonica Group]|uniref:Uncharacterized protein n=2 Tax=Oryza sativa subsp. japonica TaxID=39947 RepID=B9F8W6_ORYSJ|nr:hypothetical protein OsJ_11170 [Oryza sativa Japonica Group]